MAQREIILLATILCALTIPATDSELLSRRKRYVVFPEGSSFSIALCMTIHTLTPDNIFTEGLNWGISYDLPNESKPELEPFLQLRKDKLKPVKLDDRVEYEKDEYALAGGQQRWKPSYGGWAGKDGKYRKADYHYLQRRYRRDLYSKIEVVIDAMGYDGRSCILRALCEASQRFMPKGNSLVEEMMRIIFTLPLRKVMPFEPQEHHAYTAAHRAGHEGQDCEAAFPQCSFSLVDMALGKYDAVDDRMERRLLPPDLRYSFM